MSQMTATARAGLRAPSTKRAQQPRLQVVTGRQARQGSAGFALLCTALLVSAMLALLVLNTSRAEASFRITDLQSTSGRLADTESGLRADLALERSPSHLATRAHGLGMVPSQSAAFIRTSDGAVLGVATKASPQPDFTVVHDAAPSPAAASTPSSPADAVSVAGLGAAFAKQEGAGGTADQEQTRTTQRNADRSGAGQPAEKSTKDSTTTKR